MPFKDIEVDPVKMPDIDQIAPQGEEPPESPRDRTELAWENYQRSMGMDVGPKDDKEKQALADQQQALDTPPERETDRQIVAEYAAEQKGQKPQQEEPPVYKYKTHDEAERGYKEAERKMHELADSRKALEDEKRRLELRLNEVERMNLEWQQWHNNWQRTQQPDQKATPEKPAGSGDEDWTDVFTDDSRKALDMLDKRYGGQAEAVKDEIYKRLEAERAQNAQAQTQQRAMQAMENRWQSEYAKDYADYKWLVERESTRWMNELTQRMQNNAMTLEDRDLLAILQHDPAKLTDIFFKVAEPTIARIRTNERNNYQRETEARENLTAPPTVPPARTAQAPPTDIGDDESDAAYIEERRATQRKMFGSAL